MADTGGSTITEKANENPNCTETANEKSCNENATDKGDDSFLLDEKLITLNADELKVLIQSVVNESKTSLMKEVSSAIRPLKEEVETLKLLSNPDQVALTEKLDSANAQIAQLKSQNEQLISEKGQLLSEMSKLRTDNTEMKAKVRNFGEAFGFMLPGGEEPHMKKSKIDHSISSHTSPSKEGSDSISIVSPSTSGLGATNDSSYAKHIQNNGNIGKTFKPVKKSTPESKFGVFAQTGSVVACLSGAMPDLYKQTIKYGMYRIYHRRSHNEQIDDIEKMSTDVDFLIISVGNPTMKVKPLLDLFDKLLAKGKRVIYVPPFAPPKGEELKFQSGKTDIIKTLRSYAKANFKIEVFVGDFSNQSDSNNFMHSCLHTIGFNNLQFWKPYDYRRRSVRLPCKYCANSDCKNKNDEYPRYMIQLVIRTNLFCQCYHCSVCA